MQWYLTLMHVLAAGYLGVTQSPGTTDSYSFGTSLNSAENRLFHCPPVGNTALDLFGYGFSYQVGIKLGLANLLNVQSDSLANELLKVEPQFINSLSSTSNDNTRSSSMDSYRYFFCLAFNLYQRDGGISILGCNSLPKLQVFVQGLSIMGVSIPFCLPVQYNANSKTGRVNFMSQLILLLGNNNCDMAGTFEDTAGSPPGARAKSLHRSGLINKYLNNL